MLIWFDSFDFYEDDDIDRVYDASTGGFGSQLYISVGAGRRGTNCLEMNAISTDQYLRKFFPQASPTFVIGVAVYFETQILGHEGIRLMSNNTTQTCVVVEDNGAIRVYRGTHAGTLLGESDPGIVSADTWAYIEWKTTIDTSVGTAVVRVDGNEVVNLSGVNNDSAANGLADNMSFNNCHTAGDLRLDDLYVIIPGGPHNNDFLGDVRVDCLFPTGDGTYSDFTPSAGSNFQCVDDATPDFSNYVQTSEIDDIDTYTFDDLYPLVTDQIKAVGVNMLSGKPDAGTACIKGVTRLGGTVYRKEIKYMNRGFLGATHRVNQAIWEARPSDGQGWTEGNVNTAEFGQTMVEPTDIGTTTTTEPPGATTTTTTA